MKFYEGRRTLPSKREVQRVQRYLKSPKTISQVAAELGMHPNRVSYAIKVLEYRREIVEVDSDPVRFVGVRE